VNWLQRLKGL